MLPAFPASQPQYCRTIGIEIYERMTDDEGRGEAD